MAGKHDSDEEARWLALDMYFEQLDQWILTEEELDAQFDQDMKDIEMFWVESLYHVINSVYA